MKLIVLPLTIVICCLFWLSLVTLPLALPLMIWWRSWPKWILSLILTNGLLLPIIAFLGSCLLGPDWKGDCPNGWIDCLTVGKLALLPLVLWASAAWYAVEIHRVTAETRARPWIVLGFLHGAAVSLACCWYLLIRWQETGFVPDGLRLDPRSLAFLSALLLPFYVAAGYSIRAGQLVRAAKLKPSAYLKSLLIALPCWIASVSWAKQSFAALPDKSPDCFVVTAASRGHPAFVGPFTEITHHGRRRRANRQLVTFWQFEERWQRRAPASHAVFRRIYNFVGPVLARHLTRRWLADLTWFALKPAELLARLATRNAG